MNCPDPGIYTDIPDTIYRQWDAVSRSDLVDIANGVPLSTVKYHMDHPKAVTANMEKGTALHMCVLEPARFNKEVVPAPERPRRSNADKDWWTQFETENVGKLILSADVFSQVVAMGENLRNIPELASILATNALREASVVFILNGVKCKCRIDLLQTDDLMVPYDLKTTSDARPRPFSYSISDYGYDMQAWYYCQSLWELGYTVAPMQFFCVETSPPFNTVSYIPTESTVVDGGERALFALRKLVAAKQQNHWPGYPAGPQPITGGRYGTQVPD